MKKNIEDIKEVSLRNIRNIIIADLKSKEVLYEIKQIKDVSFYVCDTTAIVIDMEYFNLEIMKMQFESSPMNEFLFSFEFPVNDPSTDCELGGYINMKCSVEESFDIKLKNSGEVPTHRLSLYSEDKPKIVLQNIDTE